MTTVANAAPTVNPMSIPYIWGQQDARCGMTCVPEMVFVTRQDQIAYAVGFESVTGRTPTTAQVMGIDFEAEANDLAEDMLDREFWAHGC